MDFFQNEYYGNTIGQWALAFGLILLSFIVGRLLYWFLSRWVKKLTEKTQTQLDDIIIDMLEEPVSALIVAIGAMYSMRFLTFTEEFETGLSNFFAMIYSLIVTWAILRLYEAIHKNYITELVAQTETDLDDQLLPVVRTGIRFAVGSLGLIVGLNNAGYDVGAILAGLGIGGLAFALAAQDTVANMFGGVMLFVQQPFQINDKISIDGIEGDIIEIGLRSSTIEAPGGSRILVPNKTFTENPITNLSTQSSYFHMTNLHLHRNTDLDQIDMLLEAIEQISDQLNVIDWAAATLEGIHADHYDILVKYGIAIHDSKDDEFKSSFSKKIAGKNRMMKELAKLIQEQDLMLALPVRVSVFEPGPLQHEGYFNGSKQFNTAPSASSE